MSEVTLEKIDMIRDRICVSYGEAKEALQECDGDVLEAIVYLEHKLKMESENNADSTSDKHQSESIDEFKQWLKDVINKGNVNRIIVKSNGRVVMDIPVNAGVAAGVIGILVPQLILIGFFAAVVTEATVEIVKDDGTVEVVNKVVSKATGDIAHKTKDFTSEMKMKAKEMKKKAEDMKNQFKQSKSSTTVDDEGHVYSYTVKFDDDNNEV